MARQHDPGDTGALRRAQERPEVAGVGDAVDGDEERRPVRRGGRWRGRRGAPPARRRRLGQHALRGLAPRLGEELAPGSPAAPAPAPPRPAPRCRRGSDDGSGLGEDPDLPHLAPAGQQELAHGLAALDLVATDAVAPAGRPRASYACARPVPAAAPRLTPPHRAWPRLAPCLPGARRGRPALVPRRHAARRRRAAGGRLGERRGPLGALRGRRLGHRQPLRLLDTMATAKQAMPFAAPERAEPLGALALHRHRGADGVGEALLRARRGAGASFGESRTTVQSTLPGVPPAARTSATARRSRLEAVGARQAPGSVSGKCWPMSPEAGRAEQGVRDGVGDDVGVAVPGQTALPLEGDPPEDEGSRRVVAEGVDVEALTHPTVTGTGAPRRGQVDGRGDLDVARVAVHDHHPATCRLDQRRIVGALGLACVGRPQRLRPERLRGLHGHEPARGRRSRPHLAAACRSPGPPAPPRPHRRPPRRAPGPTRPATGTGRAASWTTMTLGVRRDRGQPGPHGRRAGVAPGDHDGRRAAPRASATSAGTTSTTPSAVRGRRPERPVEHAGTTEGLGTACARRSGRRCRRPPRSVQTWAPTAATLPRGEIGHTV